MRTGSSTLRFLLGDHLGSTSITTDSNGVLGSTILYYPWGGRRWSSGSIPTNYQYTDQRIESNLGLYFYNARWYDSAAGRFIQPDTDVPESQGVQAWDRYAYTNNNPVKFTDPTGHYIDSSCDNADCTIDNGDPATPVQVGLEWFTGTGPRNHYFSDGDPFTELLKQHDHIQDVRKLISQRVSEGDYDNYHENYDLSGLGGIPKYISDYSTLVSGGATGNLAVTYLGSYDLQYFVNNVDVENGTATVMFYVYNESTLASATHPPLLGYSNIWEENITPFVNGLVDEGPMSKTTQTFTWYETIKFP